MNALARGAHRIKVLLVTADIPADYLHRPEFERPRRIEANLAVAPKRLCTHFIREIYSDSDPIPALQVKLTMSLLFSALMLVLTYARGFDGMATSLSGTHPEHTVSNSTDVKLDPTKLLKDSGCLPCVSKGGELYILSPEVWNAWFRFGMSYLIPLSHHTGSNCRRLNN
jgi:hypothetical protein